ncbi:hypothetical protein G9A89_007164 [Geosiphon pyriformis]|nr:hypothetical protein G9A89_007164 [Geosiphon pyriformis]
MWDLCEWKETREFGYELDMRLFKKGQQLPIMDSVSTTVILDETRRLSFIIQSEETKKTYPNFIPIADFFKQLSAPEGSRKISKSSKRSKGGHDIKMLYGQRAHTISTDNNPKQKSQFVKRMSEGQLTENEPSSKKAVEFP